MKKQVSEKIVIAIILFFCTSLNGNINFFYQQKYSDYLRSIETKKLTEIENLYKTVSFYYLENYDQVINFTQDFLLVNQHSLLKDYHLFFRALSHLQNGEKSKAAKILISLKSSENISIKEQSILLVQELTAKSLTKKELKNLSYIIKDDTVFQNLELNNEEFNILVVLPLTGLHSEPGKELLRGIKFAFEKINSKTSFKINLEVLNSESSNSVMQKKILHYLKNKHTDLVIGELESGMSAALAGICTLKKIPLIIPVAIENNLSEIGDNIYQLNVSSYELGKKIADFAAGIKKQRIFATLAPMTKEGQEAVNGFVDRVSQYGSIVLTQEWYYDALNVERQLSRIREQILLADSLDIKEYMEYDSIKIKKVGILDGLFVPINSPDDIETVSSQITFYNFLADKYGTYGWNNLKELNKNAQNADSVIFVTENSFNLDDENYLRFSEDFRSKYQKSAGKLESMGYDAFNLVFQSLKEAYNQKKSISSILKNLEIYKGINGEIIFAKNKKANHSVEIYQYLKNRKNPLKLSDTRDLASCIPPSKENRTINLADAFFKLKEYQNAIDIYKEYWKKDTTKVSFLRKIATGYRRLHSFDSLITTSIELQNIDSLDMQPKFDIAYSYLKKDSLDLAEKLYLELDSLTEGYNSTVKYHLGEVYNSKMNFEKAINYFIEAKNIDPEIEFIDYLIGLVYWTEEKKEEALPYFIAAARKGVIEARDILREEGITWDKLNE